MVLISRILLSRIPSLRIILLLVVRIHRILLMLLPMLVILLLGRGRGSFGGFQFPGISDADLAKELLRDYDHRQNDE